MHLFTAEHQKVFDQSLMQNHYKCCKTRLPQKPIQYSTQRNALWIIDMTMTARQSRSSETTNGVPQGSEYHPYISLLFFPYFYHNIAPLTSHFFCDLHPVLLLHIVYTQTKVENRPLHGALNCIPHCPSVYCHCTPFFHTCCTPKYIVSLSIGE